MPPLLADFIHARAANRGKVYFLTTRRDRAKVSRPWLYLFIYRKYILNHKEGSYLRVLEYRNTIDAIEHGAPHSGAALLRRTSVLGRWPETLAEGQFICPEHFDQKGGGGFQPPKPKKEDILSDVLLFGTSQQYRCRTICERIIFLSTSWCAVSTSLCKFLTSGHFLLWSLRHLEIRRHRKRQFYFADHICFLPLVY